MWTQRPEGRLPAWLGSPHHSPSSDTPVSQQPSEELVPYDTDLYQRQTHEYYQYLSSDGESHSGEYGAEGPHPHFPSPAWAPEPALGSGETKKKKWPPGRLWNSENWIKLLPRGSEVTTLNPHTPAPDPPHPSLHALSICCAKVSFLHIYLLVQSLWSLYKRGSGLRELSDLDKVARWVGGTQVCLLLVRGFSSPPPRSASFHSLFLSPLTLNCWCSPTPCCVWLVAFLNLC